MTNHDNNDKLGTRTICVSSELAPAAYAGSIRTLCSVSKYMCLRMLLDFLRMSGCVGNPRKKRGNVVVDSCGWGHWRGSYSPFCGFVVSLYQLVSAHCTSSVCVKVCVYVSEYMSIFSVIYSYLSMPSCLHSSFIIH